MIGATAISALTAVAAQLLPLDRCPAATFEAPAIGIRFTRSAARPGVHDRHILRLALTYARFGVVLHARVAVCRNALTAGFTKGRELPTRGSALVVRRALLPTPAVVVRAADAGHAIAIADDIPSRAAQLLAVTGSCAARVIATNRVRLAALGAALNARRADAPIAVPDLRAGAAHGFGRWLGPSGRAGIEHRSARQRPTPQSKQTPKHLAPVAASSQ
jgi:hypothetical protein